MTPMPAAAQYHSTCNEELTMSKSLQTAIHRMSAYIANHRVALRTAVAIVAAITMLDAFAFERSLQHVLVGHSAIALGLLVALLVVESPDHGRRDAR